MPSGEEIQGALRAFVANWQDYVGTEKSEAQTFLNQLFACYGSDRQQLGAEFEFYSGAGFMDLHWPGILLVEMKAPVVGVDTAKSQVERYWRASSNQAAGQRAARFILICNFGRFQIWEYGAFPDAPVAEFALEELPDRCRADRAHQAVRRRRRGRVGRPQGAAQGPRRGGGRLLRLATLGRAGRSGTVRRLAELNREISEGRLPYAPFD